METSMKVPSTKSGKGSIRLGLNLPMFVGALIALFTGIFPGILGVWLWGAWKIAVPVYIKVGHAHAAWWSVLILLAGFLLPATLLKPAVKRFIIWTSITAVPLWMIALAAYSISKEARGVIAPLSTGQEPNIEYLAYGTGIFVFEVWLFAALAIVFLSALGVRIPRLSQEELSVSQLDLMSEIEIPRKVFRLPLLFGGLGLLVGWAMTLLFLARGLPVKPSAIVQLHTHTLFFVVGFLITIIAIRSVGAGDRAFNLAYKLGVWGIPLIVGAWILFIALELPSLIHIVPALLYFAMLVVGWLALWGKFGLRKSDEAHFEFTRGALIFLWGLMIALISVGPVIATVWDTRPNLTVTFKQPEGISYPGPYPDDYIGTAAVASSPRGLENLHLSPGSWSHVGIVWLLTLLLIGAQMGKLIGKPTLIYLIVTTIVLAPLFNAFGRFAAWAEFPAGIGGMWYAAHPLKFFNLIILGWVAWLMIRALKAKAPAGL